MDEESQADIAIAAYQQLEELHRSFMRHVESLSGNRINGGVISVVEDELVAECLGVKMRAPHRQIARDGYLIAIEYPFIAKHLNEDIFIWALYLEADDGLFLDSRQEKRYCDRSNSYFDQKIVQSLASALIRSAVFSPRS